MINREGTMKRKKWKFLETYSFFKWMLNNNQTSNSFFIYLLSFDEFWFLQDSVTFSPSSSLWPLLCYVWLFPVTPLLFNKVFRGTTCRKNGIESNHVYLGRIYAILGLLLVLGFQQLFQATKSIWSWCNAPSYLLHVPIVKRNVGLISLITPALKRWFKVHA